MIDLVPADGLVNVLEDAPGMEPGIGALIPVMQFRVGFDLVQISRISDSKRVFGDAFKNRLFTPLEISYADAVGSLNSERLAARFAAKEAVIKALRLSEAGVSWHEIEVVRQGDGDCEIALHGHVAELADAMGLTKLRLSLSHDGDYAGAFVTALFSKPNTGNIKNALTLSNVMTGGNHGSN